MQRISGGGLALSPTARTLAHLRKLGYRAAIVEKWNAFAKIRQDLFNIGDVLAMRPNEPLLLVQCTVTAKLNDRMAKDPETCAQWLSTGNRLEFWGWRKGGAKGKRKTYVLTVRVLSRNSFTYRTWEKDRKAVGIGYATSNRQADETESPDRSCEILDT